MSTALVETTATLPVAFTLDAEKVALIKRNIAVGASDDELALFIAQCERRQLDPFARQIFCVGRWDGRAKRNVFSTQASIDGLRLIAQRTGEYAGQTKAEWCGPDGVWVDVWLDSKPPAAARKGIYRRGNVEATMAVALWASYVQTVASGEPNSMWKKMGPSQLAKCAEALALRQTFPEELSGLYSQDEMGQAENPPPATVTPAVTAAAVAELSRIREAPHAAPAAAPTVDGPPPVPYADPETGEIALDPEEPEEAVIVEQPDAAPPSPDPATVAVSPPAPAAGSDLMSDAQLRKIAVMFREKKFPDDKVIRHGYVVAIVNREFGSTKELTKREASKLIEALMAEEEWGTEPAAALDDGPF